MSITTFPYELACRAATVLGSKVEASITVRQHGVTVRAGSSTGAAGRCDQAESLADSGPCIAAMEALSVHVVPLIEDEDRWDAWRAQAAREGFTSALAVPAQVDEQVALALNLYSRSPDPWTPELLTAAEGYAQLGAAMVRLHLGLAELDDGAAGYYSQMSDTVTIERAIGAIMQTNDCTEPEARKILESASLHRNVAQHEVAETILRALVINEPRTGT
ncbi:GAF and ANTAR domain-containing protein [Promicromonospora iranensis]|jgi:hypothetical protein|uniref:GAF and ANTAR domain-containing protein n=1 Tax=Promicromonospora iranensis TaxID=1105144 RepID=UPI0023A95A70|nr:GAF and ANTAR domain-containing protein [Promicromonospora iranensis]